MTTRRFSSGDPCIKVTDEDLRRMSLDEIKELATSIGLCIDGVSTLEHARNVIIKAAKEIVNF